MHTYIEHVCTLFNVIDLATCAKSQKTFTRICIYQLMKIGLKKQKFKVQGISGGTFGHGNRHMTLYEQFWFLCF